MTRIRKKKPIDQRKSSTKIIYMENAEQRYQFSTIQIMPPIMTDKLAPDSYSLKQLTVRRMLNSHSHTNRQTLDSTPPSKFNPE